MGNLVCAGEQLSKNSLAWPIFMEVWKVVTRHFCDLTLLFTPDAAKMEVILAALCEASKG